MTARESRERHGTCAGRRGAGLRWRRRAAAAAAEDHEAASCSTRPEADAILAALQVFPPDNPWNQDISALPVHKDSAQMIAVHRRGQVARVQPRHGLHHRARPTRSGCDGQAPRLRERVRSRAVPAARQRAHRELAAHAEREHEGPAASPGRRSSSSSATPRATATSSWSIPGTASSTSSGRHEAHRRRAGRRSQRRDLRPARRARCGPSAGRRRRRRPAHLPRGRALRRVRAGTGRARDALHGARGRGAPTCCPPPTGRASSREPAPAADGRALPPAQGLRRLRLPAPRAGDPEGPQDLRHVRGRQRQRLADVDRPRPPPEGPGGAPPREGLRLRGRGHGRALGARVTSRHEALPDRLRRARPELATGRAQGVRGARTRACVLAGCCDIEEPAGRALSGALRLRPRVHGPGERCSTPSGRTRSWWWCPSSGDRRRRPQPSCERGLPLLAREAAGRTAAEVDRLIAAAGTRRPARPASGRLQPPFRPRSCAELRRRLDARRAAAPIQHLHYEMTRVDRREPDFSITAIHGLDAVRYLAGSDYAAGALPLPRACPTLGPGVANIFVDAVMTSRRHRAPRLLPRGRAWLVERATVARARRDVLPARADVGRRRLARAVCSTSTTAGLVADVAGDASAATERSLRARRLLSPSTRRFLGALGRGRRAVARACARRASRWRSRSTSAASASSEHEGHDECPAAAAAAAPAVCPRGARPRGPGRRPVRLDAWRVIGPGGGGTMRRPAISPHDPQGRGRRLRHDGRLHHARRRRELADVQPRRRRRRRSPSIPATPEMLYAATARALPERGRAAAPGGMVFPDPAQNTAGARSATTATRVFTTDDPAYPGSGRDVTIHAVAVDPDDPRRAWSMRGERAESAGPRHRPQSPTLAPRLDGPRPDAGRARARWTRSGSSRSHRRTAAARRRGARDRRERRLRGRAGGWQRLEPPGGAQASRRAASGAIRARASSRLRDAPRSRRGIRGRVHVSEDGGRTLARRQRHAARRDRRRRPGRELGPGQGSRPRARPDRRVARPGLVAYVGLRGSSCRGRGDAAFNGIAKTTDGGRTLDGRARGVRPAVGEPRRLLDRGARARGRPLRLVRRALRPRGRPRTIPTSASPPTSSGRTARADGGQTWAQANSGATRRRRLGEPRPRRDHHLRRPLGPVRHEARLHPVHRHRPLPERGRRRRRWTGSSTRRAPSRWRNTTYWLAFDPEVKDLMWGGFSGTHDLPRPKMWRRTDPDALPGRGRRLHGRRPALDSRRTAGMPEIGDHARPRRPDEPEGPADALRDRLRPRRLQVHGQRRAPGRSKNAGLAGPRTSPSRGGSRARRTATLYLVVARRSERRAIGDARRRRRSIARRTAPSTGRG